MLTQYVPVLVVSSSLLADCTVGPDYNRYNNCDEIYLNTKDCILLNDETFVQISDARAQARAESTRLSER